MLLKKLDSPEIHTDIDLGLNIADLLGWNADERNVQLILWNDATFQVQVQSFTMNFGISAGDCRVCHKPARVVTALCLTSDQYDLANVLEGLCLTCFKYKLHLDED